MAVYRSFLFAPGNHTRRVEKALSLDADATILDLEDACPIARRERRVPSRSPPASARARARLHPRQRHDDRVRYGDIVAVVQRGSTASSCRVEQADEIGPSTGDCQLERGGACRSARST